MKPCTYLTSLVSRRRKHHNQNIEDASKSSAWSFFPVDRSCSTDRWSSFSCSVRLPNHQPSGPKKETWAGNAYPRYCLEHSNIPLQLPPNNSFKNCPRLLYFVLPSSNSIWLEVFITLQDSARVFRTKRLFQTCGTCLAPSRFETLPASSIRMSKKPLWYAKNHPSMPRKTTCCMETFREAPQKNQSSGPGLTPARTANTPLSLVRDNSCSTSTMGPFEYTGRFWKEMLLIPHSSI